MRWKIVSKFSTQHRKISLISSFEISSLWFKWKRSSGILVLILQNKFHSFFNDCNSFNHFSSVSFLFVHYSSIFRRFCFLSIASLYISCCLKLVLGLPALQTRFGQGKKYQFWSHFRFIIIILHVCDECFFDPFKFLSSWISFGFDFIQEVIVSE